MEYISQRSNKGELLEGILLIKPNIFRDSRGFFMESWNSECFNKAIKREIIFVQDNQSLSLKGVLRGLHYQLSPFSQGKLVRCLKGKIFDVAIDIRKDSKTFCQWVGVFLDSQNNYQLWIPEGYAHGFLTLSEEACVAYKTNQYWKGSHEMSIKWNDPKISIKWPREISNPILSDKDLEASFIDKIDHSKLLL